jgi:hypothetical protein
MRRRWLRYELSAIVAISIVDVKQHANLITATGRQIDRLVYELYGLTEDEIRIVEEATAR